MRTSPRESRSSGALRVQIDADGPCLVPYGYRRVKFTVHYVLPVSLDEAQRSAGRLEGHRHGRRKLWYPSMRTLKGTSSHNKENVIDPFFSFHTCARCGKRQCPGLRGVKASSGAVRAGKHCWHPARPMQRAGTRWHQHAASAPGLVLFMLDCGTLLYCTLLIVLGRSRNAALLSFGSPKAGHPSWLSRARGALTPSPSRDHEHGDVPHHRIVVPH